MMLVDTSIWIDHLHQPDASLERLLDEEKVVVHPFVLGELACGNIRQRTVVLGQLSEQPQAEPIENDKVLDMVEASRLHGRGLNLVDAHILASALVGNHQVMTGDKRLAIAAADLGIQVVGKSPASDP